MCVGVCPRVTEFSFWLPSPLPEERVWESLGALGCFPCPPPPPPESSSSGCVLGWPAEDRAPRCEAPVPALPYVLGHVVVSTPRFRDRVAGCVPVSQQFGCFPGTDTVPYLTVGSPHLVSTRHMVSGRRQPHPHPLSPLHALVLM